MNEKQCVTCQTVKPVTEFHQRHDGKVPKPCGECKDCRRKRSKKRHSENVEHHRELVKKRYDSFGRFDRYGITAELYEKVLAEQGGKCKLCGTYTPGGKGIWHIDHAHGAEEYVGFPRKRGVFKQCGPEDFRGLLCARCNISLGHFESLIERVGLKSIDDYLNINIKLE